MKHTALRPLWCFLVLALFVLVTACNRHTDSQLSINLNALDKALETDYLSMRLNRVDSLSRVRGKSSRDEWERLQNLSGLYGDLNVDSALVYAKRAESLAPDSVCRIRSRLSRGSIYNASLMMYKEAFDIFLSTDPQKNDSTLMCLYYTFGVQLYKNLEEMATEKGLREKYADLKRGYRDSVLNMGANSLFIEANQLMDKGRYSEALEILQREEGQSEYSPVNGAIYDLISQVYALQGNEEREMEYLALAAKADIMNGVREYRALPRLAMRLYEYGDLSRAYGYMQRSIEDARTCNARFRMLDMTEAMSVISDSYAHSQQEARLKMVILLLFTLLLLGVTATSLYYARQRNRLLRESRRRQADANRKLQAAGKIREKYVRHFMHLSLEYIEKMDSYRKELFKKGAKRNFDLLFDAIRSTAYIDRESESFYRNFDKAFLELYPDFVERFNDLLRPEERVELRHEGELNTDLRIFALMRLGICESSEIAKFLHCSQSTVYNYRTKYRAKAIDKEEFVRCTFNHTPS